MTALTELLARVEKLEGPDREVDCAIAVAIDGFFEIQPRYDGDEIGYGYVDAEGTHIHPGHGGDQLVRRYTASLDAIRALTKRVLPEWSIISGEKNGKGAAVLQGPREGEASECEEAPTEPLACCVALLRALIAQDGSDG